MTDGQASTPEPPWRYRESRIATDRAATVGRSWSPGGNRARNRSGERCHADRHPGGIPALPSRSSRVSPCQPRNRSTRHRAGEWVCKYKWSKVRRARVWEQVKSDSLHSENTPWSGRTCPMDFSLASLACSSPSAVSE